MKFQKTMWQNLQTGCKQWLKRTIILLITVSLSFSLCRIAWSAETAKPLLISVLAQGNAITDPNALLRYALPIDNETVRQLQGEIEDIANHLRGKRWSPMAKDVKNANFLVTVRKDKLLEGIPASDLPQAESLLEEISTEISQLQDAVNAKDKPQVQTIRRQLLSHIGGLEALMVTEFPFEIPEDYANLPQLKGRAAVEMETTQGTLTIVVDGYSAPITAGNFIDLVQRGFYDGLPFVGIEDDFVIQTGDPEGDAAGFIDPKNQKYRAIPLEILEKGQEEPIYGMTLEDAGIYLPELALPFNAYGAVALARPPINPNGGSSQIFFFKFDSELTPPGFNLMDGRYAVFGYTVEGQEVLKKLTDKDKVLSVKVIDGLDNLVQPSQS